MRNIFQRFVLSAQRRAGLQRFKRMYLFLELAGCGVHQTHFNGITATAKLPFDNAFTRPMRRAEKRDEGRQVWSEIAPRSRNQEIDIRLPGNPKGKDVQGVLAKHYRDCALVTIADLAATAAMTWLEPEALNGTDALKLYVFANDRRGHAVVMGLLDNLGKGAAGQAVQNMNLMLGLDEMAGLKPAPAAR